jgi:hypothetical protein
MSIQDLQDTLREHAGAVDDTGLVGRAAAARRRASSIRRRRTLAAVAAAAIVLPLAGMAALDVNPLHRSAPVVKPTDPTPDLFVGSFAGRTLIDSEVVTGRNEVVLTAQESRNTEWRAMCRGVGSDYTLHLSLDDGEPGELPCDVELLSGRWIAYQLGPEYPLHGEHTLRVWLTRTSDGANVAPSQGHLGAAVYRIPEPVATVAGHQVQGLEVDGGEEFRLTSYEESESGDRVFSSTYIAGDLPVEVDWYTSGTGRPNVQVYVDGRPETTLPLGEGGPGLVLAPGRSHTVKLRVLDTAPPDTLLGFVWREQVP